MSTNVVIPADPSMADLRAMITTAPDPATALVEAKPKASEAAALAVEEHHEAATEPAEKKPEAVQTDEEPLPEGVKKRIAKEAEKAAAIQSEIDRAVSARKAKEAELEKIKGGEKGSEPVNTPQSPATAEPKEPVFAEAGHDKESWGEYEDRRRGYTKELTAWIKAEAVREVEAKTTAAAAQAESTKRWEAAVAKHGADFPALMESARAIAPPELQAAIVSMEHWSDVAVHLAKNPEKLKDLAAKFVANPFSAYTTLGRIEAALTAVSKPVAPPLPEPLATAGGNASVSTRSLQDVLAEGSMSQLRAAVKKATTRA